MDIWPLNRSVKLMSQVPFYLIAIGAFVAFVLYKRGREKEVLPEYARALFDLADQRELAGESDAKVEDLRAMARAVSAVSAGQGSTFSPERKSELRYALSRASSPFQLEEAGILPGTPRHVHAYRGVMRELGKL